MSYKLTIMSESGTFNARYERLDNFKKPSVVAKAPNGDVVKERSFYGDVELSPGSTQRKWVDDNGKQYAKSELTFEYEGEVVTEIEKTTVMQIDGYAPLSDYTDKYAISSYYEVFPDDNGMKKDIDKDVAVASNLTGMYKLYKDLSDRQQVGRGSFCSSSRGFVESDGYVRAINIGGKWGLEIGQFKQAKTFNHLNSGEPTTKVAPKPAVKKTIRSI